MADTSGAPAQAVPQTPQKEDMSMQWRHWDEHHEICIHVSGQGEFREWSIRVKEFTPSNTAKDPNAPGTVMDLIRGAEWGTKPLARLIPEIMPKVAPSLARDAVTWLYLIVLAQEKGPLALLEAWNAREISGKLPSVVTVHP